MQQAFSEGLGFLKTKVASLRKTQNQQTLDVKSEVFMLLEKVRKIMKTFPNEISISYAQM